MEEKLYEEIDKDDKADELCNKLCGILMQKKIYCDDEETVNFLQEELGKVQDQMDLLYSGDKSVRNYILEEYPKVISSYIDGGENNEQGQANIK